jgi:hypothetical protein
MKNKLLLVAIAFSVLASAIACMAGGKIIPPTKDYTLSIWQAAPKTDGPLNQVGEKAPVKEGKQFSISLDPVHSKQQPEAKKITYVWFKGPNKVVPEVKHTAKENFYVLKSGTYTIIATFKVGGKDTYVERTFVAK